MCTYLMAIAFGTLSKACSRLAAGLDGMVGCSIMIGAITMHMTLSSTFQAMDTTPFYATAGALCTNFSLYSILCLVPSPTNLLVRLVIAKVN